LLSKLSIASLRFASISMPLMPHITLFPEEPLLFLNVSTLLRPVLLLEVSTTGPELHLNVSALQRLVLLLEVSTTQGPELHLDVSA
jgi:hypothetical protein